MLPLVCPAAFISITSSAEKRKEEKTLQVNVFQENMQRLPPSGEDGYHKILLTHYCY